MRRHQAFALGRVPWPPLCGINYLPGPIDRYKSLRQTQGRQAGSRAVDGSLEVGRRRQQMQSRFTAVLGSAVYFNNIYTRAFSRALWFNGAWVCKSSMMFFFHFQSTRSS